MRGRESETLQSKSKVECANFLLHYFICHLLRRVFFRAAEQPALGTDVTGSASRGLIVGVTRSDGRVTVAKVELPLPSTAPGFVHVTLDSSGSCKDVPIEQLYSFRLDAHEFLTENVESRAQVAPVRNAVRCYELLTALFLLHSFFAPSCT